MNIFRLQRGICISGNMPLHIILTKSILFLFMSFVLCTETFADYYRVTAPNGLNVRTSASKHGEVLGKLPKNDIVNVTSIKDGWANINYNGWQGYVSVSYLTAVTSEGKATSSSSKESWSFFSWLFNSEGESAWFTGLKWIFFLGVAIFLVKIAFLVIAQMIAFGILFGIIFLLIGFIIKWIGWIEADTMWFIAKCGYCLGNLWGLLNSIFHFGRIIDDATDSGSSSSSNNDNGLKCFSVTVDGHEYILTQDSQYSECDYTDQFGGKWNYDSQGFHRV